MYLISAPFAWTYFRVHPYDAFVCAQWCMLMRDDKSGLLNLSISGCMQKPSTDAERERERKREREREAVSEYSRHV